MTASPRGDLDPPTLPAPTGGPGWSNTATDAALRARPYVLARGLAPWLSFARRVPGWVRRVRRPGGPPQPAGGLRLTHGEVALLLAVLTMLACLGVAFGAAAQRSRAGAGLPAGADRQGEWSGPVGPDAAPWWFPRPSPTGPAPAVRPEASPTAAPAVPVASMEHPASAWVPRAGGARPAAREPGTADRTVGRPDDITRLAAAEPPVALAAPNVPVPGQPSATGAGGIATTSEPTDGPRPAPTGVPPSAGPATASPDGPPAASTAGPASSPPGAPSPAPSANPTPQPSAGAGVPAASATPAGSGQGTPTAAGTAGAPSPAGTPGQTTP